MAARVVNTAAMAAPMFGGEKGGDIVGRLRGAQLYVSTCCLMNSYRFVPISTGFSQNEPRHSAVVRFVPAHGDQVGKD